MLSPSNPLSGPLGTRAFTLGLSMSDEADKPTGPRGPYPTKTDPNAMRPHGPAESGDRLALQGRVTIQNKGGAVARGQAAELGAGPAVNRLTGAEGRGQVAGEDVGVGSAAGSSTANGVGASIAEATGSMSGRSSEAADIADIRGHVGLTAATQEEKFELLRARVTALEITRRSIDQFAPGMGHNRGPSNFEPASSEDLAEIDHLIVLLKQQTPTTVIKRQALLEAQEKTSKIAEKIKEYLDVFFKEMTKSLGSEAGKLLARAPLWYGLYATLHLVGEAASHWLHGLG
jgi:hypothetical protein